MKDVESIMTLAPVIPVLIIDDVAHARPIAEALVAGGLCALEVTLRTPAALEVIREMAKVEGAVVGAGTVLNEHDLYASIQAGARFIVSPGLTEVLKQESSCVGNSFPARHRHRRRHHARIGYGPEPVQILSGCCRRRHSRPQGAFLSLPAMPLLPDRRHHPGERRGVACARLGSVRGRNLARPAGLA